MHLLSLQPREGGGGDREREWERKGCEGGGEKGGGRGGGGYVEEEKSKTMADWFHPSILVRNNPWFLGEKMPLDGGRASSRANKQSEPRSRAALQYPWASSTSYCLSVESGCLKTFTRSFQICLYRVTDASTQITHWWKMIDLGKCVKYNRCKMKAYFRGIKWWTSGNYFPKRSRSDDSALHWQIIEPPNQILSKSGLIIRQGSNNREAEVVTCVVAVWRMSELFTGRG